MATAKKTQAPASPTIIGAAAAPKAAREMFVACKLPNGMVLQLQRKESYWEDTPSGAKERLRFVKEGRQIVVCGPAYPVMPPRGYPRQFPQEGGFGLTFGVDAAFFEQWIEQNKDAPYVVNGMIFGAYSEEDLRAQCRELERRKSGLEPLEVTAEKVIDDRIPKPQNPNVFYSEADLHAAKPAA